MSNGYVIVHSGAGNYVDSNNYKKVCQVACKEASEILLNGGSAIDACEKAIELLENCDHTNAGKKIIINKKCFSFSISKFNNFRLWLEFDVE